MRFETINTGSQLVRSFGLSPDFIAELRAYESRIPNSVTVPLDLKASQVYPCVGLVTKWLGTFKECVMWPVDYGIWPSSENWSLYEALRLRFGSAEPLNTAPVHVFANDETPALMSFMHVAIEFGWGVLLAAVPKVCIVFLSHDGWMKVVHDDAIDVIVADLQEFGLLDHLP